MKVVAFNGSPRKDGNTTSMVKLVFEELEKEGISTELIQLSGKNIHGCIACYKCFDNKNQRCAVDKDVLNECIEKMLAADGIILASPTYVTDVTTEMKALIDRSCLVGKANDDMFRRKVGAAVVVHRRGGAVHAFDTINHFFLIGQMIVPGSCYWNFAVGRNIGEAQGDEEGIRTMKILGENMAWLLKRIHGE
jgi:multimeric flavodoxin WrbA